jgi:hypothetical protein
MKTSTNHSVARTPMMVECFCSHGVLAHSALPGKADGRVPFLSVSRFSAVLPICLLLGAWASAGPNFTRPEAPVGEQWPDAAFHG